jgi:hypothetical protein
MLTQWREKDDGTLSGPALEADDGVIKNVTVTQDNLSNLTQHTGRSITVSSELTLFDLANPVDVISGYINGGGGNMGGIIVTWGDGSTDILFNEKTVGEDSNGDQNDSKSIPPLKNVKKLVVNHGSTSSDGEYGFGVLTK